MASLYAWGPVTPTIRRTPLVASWSRRYDNAQSASLVQIQSFFLFSQNSLTMRLPSSIPVSRALSGIDTSTTLFLQCCKCGSGTMLLQRCASHDVSNQCFVVNQVCVYVVIFSIFLSPPNAPICSFCSIHVFPDWCLERSVSADVETAVSRTQTTVFFGCTKKCWNNFLVLWSWWCVPFVRLTKQIQLEIWKSTPKY